MFKRNPQSKWNQLLPHKKRFVETSEEDDMQPGNDNDMSIRNKKPQCHEPSIIPLSEVVYKKEHKSRPTGQHSVLASSQESDSEHSGKSQSNSRKQSESESESEHELQ